MLNLQPITYPEACRFIESVHRHHLPPQGWKFGIAVNDGQRVVGVITVGRPVSRMLDDGWTLEVTRCATNGTKNAPSMLYGAASRAAFALGYKRIITYTMQTEPGTSLVSANWRKIGEAGGGTWNRMDRPRVDTHPVGQKILWESAISTSGEARVRREPIVADDEGNDGSGREQLFLLDSV